MICADTAEYVSALCDGEIIPPDAAQHIGDCPECQARLHDYLAMGVELRRVASVETSAPVSSLTLEPNPRSKPSLWQKGWETMRIPKFAFALLVVAVLALASSLAVVKVGARSEGSVLSLKADVGLEKPLICALSAVDPNQNVCAIFLTKNRRSFGYRLKFLARDGDRAQLDFRSKDFGPAIGPHTFSPFDLEYEPGQQIWLRPGETLTLNIPGDGDIHVTGEWLDHMPSLPTLGEKERFDPGPAELRFVSPLLLRDKKVVGDLEGASTTLDKPDGAGWVYFPGEGAFIISVSHILGGREASVNMNRISFEENGRSYTFITGAPVSREKHLWVLHQLEFKPQPPQSAGFLGSLTLRETSPGVWESPLTPHD